jgi:hypothetical protein
MAGYTHINLRSDVEDMAPRHGMEGLEPRFNGVVELSQWDAVRVPAGAIRATEAGPDGVEIIAFGAPNNENSDTEIKPGWWPDA